MEIGVYGLGRFGSFWASVLAQHATVKGYNRSPGRATPAGVKRVDEDALLCLPVIFICTAISSFEEVIRRIAGRIRPGTLILDTCSVKSFPAHVMESQLPPEAHVIATHPMFGPDSAKDGVEGLPLIYCPVRVDRETGDFWKHFFGSMGLNVLPMTPQDHDREAAFTQGITHYVGRVLADLGLTSSKIATLGYQKLLEIMDQTCNDPWQLFLDLQRYNPYTRAMRVKLHRSLDRVMEMLESSLDMATGDGYHKS